MSQQWAAWSDLYASTNSPDLSGTSADQGFFGDVEGAWKAWQDGNIGLGDALASVGDSMAYRLRGANRDYQLTTRAGAAVGTFGFGITTVVSAIAAIGTSETGAGAVGFGLLAGYSADQTQANFRTLISGETVEPAGAQLFEASGMSPIVANGLYAMPGLVMPSGDLGEASAVARWVDAEDVESYVAGLQTKVTPTSTNAGLFEVEQTGPLNYRVVGGGTAIDADGYQGTMLLDAKYVSDPAISPYVDNSDAPAFLRDKILAQQQYEFERYQAVINDPSVPFEGLNVLTNEPSAVPYFQRLFTQYQVPGEVKVVPTKIPQGR